MGPERHTVAIFAPVLTLSVTIEAGRQGDPDEVHFHPAGQGFWVARMLRHLGQRPLLCGPVGGEPGRVIKGLMQQWGIDMSPVESSTPSSTTVQDRRSGERIMIAQTTSPRLDRHTLDDTYGRFLDLAITAGVAVISGQYGEVVPVEAYRRLAHDLAASEVKVVGDLHGEELRAFLDGGEVEMLKVSDQDLKDDGWDFDDDDDTAFELIEDLRKRGAMSVVLSRADRPALAQFGDQRYRAVPPRIDAADFRGAGDSMTAGLAAGLCLGYQPVEMLRLACGAGAANVTRHGLGSGISTLIHNLADRVEIESLVNASP